MSELVNELIAAANELPTALPGKMVLLGRAVVQLEGVALRADPQYRIVDDVFPSAARIALARGGGGARVAAGVAEGLGVSSTAPPLLLTDLLQDPTDGSWSLERLRDLLAVAESLDAEVRADQGGGVQGGSGSGAAAVGGGGRSGGGGGGGGAEGWSSTSSDGLQPLIDQLLDSPAARDLVAQQGAVLIDVMARDAWRRGSSAVLERYKFGPVERDHNPTFETNPDSHVCTSTQIPTSCNLMNPRSTSEPSPSTCKHYVT